MPDILIRLDEMPQAGQSITIAENIDGALFARSEPVGIFRPIVVIPPHGDLIDRDAILNAEKTKPIAKMMMFGGAYVIDLDVVRDAPVVVPAERSDTDA